MTLAVNRKMLEVCGCPIQSVLRNEPNPATIVVDAVLGTGLKGSATGPSLEAIQKINSCFANAAKVAVDIPSGLPSDETKPEGDFVRADCTVTFTALKKSQAFSGSYGLMGKLAVYPIGSPPDLYSAFQLHLTEPGDIGYLFAKRPGDSNKGMYGHVWIIGGSFGKSGAPAMAGLGSYRAGAGLVTVAIPKSVLTAVASVRPELMTEPLAENENGLIHHAEAERLLSTLEKMTCIAVGPGLGTGGEVKQLVRRLYCDSKLPGVFDADALNVLAGDLPPANGKVRVLTPHPGEMSRLAGVSTKEVQADRLGTAQTFAANTGATVVLKGDRTVIAFPDGETWINPTGSPSMATGGTGDILTGMIAGCIAQHPKDWRRAVVAAVWLHGRCGELAAERLGEQCTLATDLLDSLPRAIDEIRPV